MTAGIRHDDLRKRNRALVIRAVRRAGQPSRTELAGLTGLSHSTISAIAADLIAEGTLAETKPADAAASRRGRPQVALALNPRAGAVATVVLSLGRLSVALVDYAGTVVAEQSERLPTLTAEPGALVARVTAALRGLLARGGGDAGRLMRICLAVQGITDSAGRTLLWSPITPHSDIAFAPALEKAFAVPVAVVNDCNMIATALTWRAPQRHGDDFVAVLLSNGIGMGLMHKGALFSGTRSSAGEFGHMIHRPHGALCRCGRRGCIEAYAGNYAIWRKAEGHDEQQRPVADIDAGAMAALAARARAADGPERTAFRAAGEAIGFGLGSLFAVFDPAPVVFVGQGTAAFDLLEPVIREALGRTAGGQAAGALAFETEANELPLIRHGCAMTALTQLDRAVFALGAEPAAARGRAVA
ncbi:ROK family protein [Aquibium sp. A9E412]|uniref:ROK family protein n=1 Tax=Aquibium sp. A9E412 TaxID=2976767 RepID=UPI0025B17649|nr:ROK family protein [Aquibium sp. A9E412]MDN2565386.1 ROK family protein [Aquibium sp. A9E412]